MSKIGELKLESEEKRSRTYLTIGAYRKNRILSGTSLIIDNYEEGVAPLAVTFYAHSTRMFLVRDVSVLQKMEIYLKAGYEYHVEVVVPEDNIKVTLTGTFYDAENY